MRKLVNRLFHLFYQQRYKSIRRFMREPEKVQNELLRSLIQSAKHTEWGRRHGYQDIRDAHTFARQVPLQEYEDLKPFITRMMQGEKDVLWHGQVRWFSKSSGTTNDKSKFIPVSNQSLKSCHIRGTWDTMTLFYHNRPDARQFEAKSMLMGGSLAPFPDYPKTMIGDVSAIMIRNMPYVGRPFFIPSFEVALMPEWEEKMEHLALAGIRERDVVMVGGVPTWTVVLFRRMLELTGKEHMLEIWPNFQGYIHGGVSFTPYRKQFQAFFPSETVSYQEIYNASEGYFAVQDDFSGDGLLLLLNNGIYYEFIPMAQWGAADPQAIPLHAVREGENYALVISTNGGLWRYLPGDTVTFVSTRPYRIKITGRTKQFVNAFGEEVMVDNTDQALAKTCSILGVSVAEYTVAPVYFDNQEKGSHQWLIEFAKEPDDLERFTRMLDQELQKVNSDYEAKRYRDMALQQLTVRPVPIGTFLEWMRSRGKFGGQHKVPRLSNDRKVVNAILEFISQSV